MSEPKLPTTMRVIYSRWGADGEVLGILPGRMRFDSEERIRPTPEPTWLLDCYDVDKDEPRTLRMDKIRSFTGYEPWPEVDVLNERIKDQARQIAQLQDAQRVVRQMAAEAQTSGEPLDHRHVYNLMHTGTCHSEVYVAELKEMRIILGNLLDTQDTVRHHTYEHGSITHEELSRIMAHQFDRQRTEEGRTLLERVGRIAAAILGKPPYVPVGNWAARTVNEDSVISNMSVAANRLREAAAAPVPSTSARGYHKGWKAAMEAAVAAYRGEEKWLL